MAAPYVGADGRMVAVVASVRAAIDLAVMLQREAERQAGRRVLRVALTIGDVFSEAPDHLEGPAIAAAHVLLDRVRAGQILATDLVARLDTGRNRELHPAGMLTGEEGLGNVVEVVEIAWHPLPGMAGAVVGMPGAVRAAIGGAAGDRGLPMVGRGPAGQVLQLALEHAREGIRQTVVVSGEAGSGKSRLVGELGTCAYQRGTMVLWGSCRATGDVPYEPFVDALRPLIAGLDEGRRAKLLDGLTDDLAVLLPRLLGRAPDRPVDTTASRYWMFEAVVELLGRLAAEAPVLLVVDDLHWALESTARLFEHVARNGATSRLCVVATVRDTPDEQTEAARTLVAELPRLPHTTRVLLGGLDDDALTELVGRLLLRPVNDEGRVLAAHLQRVTGGNPFFVGELWHHLVDTGTVRRVDGRWRVHGDLRSVRSPSAVREVINRRVEALGADVASVLAVAGLAGSPFDIALLTRAAGLDHEQVLAALDGASDAGLIAEDAPGSYRFRHDLVGHALTDALQPNARRRAHLALARALEAEEPQRLALVAAHYRRAVPLVEPAVAAQAALRAADRALAANAFDDAASALTDVLPVVEDPLLRSDLLAKLAEVTAIAGELERAAAAADEAAALANNAGDRDRLAAVAALFHEIHWRSDGRVDHRPELVAAALQHAEGAARARLLVTSATALSFQGRDDEAVAVGAEAIALAREAGDEALLSRVIHGALFAGWLSPPRLREREQLAIEAAELARRAGDHEATVRNLMKHHFAASVLGQGHVLRACSTEMTTEARLVRQPWLMAAVAAIESITALAFGHLSEAEAAVARFEEWGRRLPDPPAGAGMLTFSVKREQGRLAELRPVAEILARLGPGAVAWRPGLAALYAEVGLFDEAALVLDGLARDGLPLGEDHLRLVTLSYLADTAVATAHPIAATLAQELQPWSGLSIWAPGMAVHGAVDRYLGRLAAVTGRLDDARHHLEAAVRLDDDAGWVTWQAHSRLALGAFLMQHGRRTESDRGHDLVTSAAALAQTHGLAAVAARCRPLLERPIGPAEREVALTTREAEILRLVAAGLTNREIGEQLHTSRHTVANQIHSILTKTGCVNRAEAIDWAHRSGLLAG